ncbi:hypothetical protein JCM19231_4288 [Vibrio ishigakensis]|uniref:Uncharacterized protein n=1 Tax=Vibrio ishigakensis TaxID=1481914 RepID=A0A0B8NYW9_9VIBR|nr:hypothetical protein JCM19231_4288 [Vibrio ishigakensis]
MQDFEMLAPLGHVVIFGLLGGMGETNLQAEASSTSLNHQRSLIQKSMLPTSITTHW